MINRRKFLKSGTVFAGSALALSACDLEVTHADLKPAPFAGRARAEQSLIQRLSETNLKYGSAVHLMAFKETSEFEIWLEDENFAFQHFATLPICAFSGGLGPKLREGDGQTPEGFYEMGPEHLHPWSSYHLAIDIGFPNTFDRQLDRTGSYLEIHGSCESIGCYSLGDRGVEDVYLLVEQSFLQGARRATFAGYPFRPSAERLAQEEGHVWHEYWRNIAGSYAMFMATKRPPYYQAAGGKYYFFPF